MEDRIVIVGAGPVGLVVALRLAGFGIPCTVVEKEARVSDDLRASTFHPPTLDMLEAYGITALLLEHGLICPTWQIRMHETGEKAEFDLAMIGDETGHPYRLQCEQAHLSRILAERLETDSAVEIRYGAELIAIEQDNDGVTAILRHGEEEVALKARYLVGADGGQGVTRKLVGLDFIGETYPETTVLATTTFPFHDVIEGLSNVNYCWSPNGNFALLRLPRLWRCSLYFDPSLSLDQAIETERLQAQLREIHPAEEPFEVTDRRPYRVHQGIVTDYRRGRVLLAGDAAHLNSPSGGMGMNGGIHDAFNLTDKLKAIWDGADDRLLDLYSRQRRPIAERQIIQQADRNRSRMLEKDSTRRIALLRDLQAIAGNPSRARTYLLRSSMIEGLRESMAIA